MMEKPMNVTMRHVLSAMTVALLLAAPGCRGKGADDAAQPQAGLEPESGPTIVLKAGAREAAGIAFAQAAPHVFSRRLAAPGELAFNARRLAHLTARTPGRVERVLAVAGDRVRAGQVLAEVYSPDFMALQAEYLQAAERAKRYADDGSEARPARAILKSARERLLLVGAVAAEVDGLAAAGVPRPLLLVRAPFAGSVIEAGVLAGDHVELGTSLFRLADPSVLWAELHVQVQDLAFLKAGSTVEVRVQAYPKEVFPGRLLLVGDLLDDRTRTLPARVEVANPAGKLKAGMYVEALLESAGGRTALAVPEAAVQDDDGRDIVFVRSAAGAFSRREVRTGERGSGQVEVLAGLAAGETVVTSGSFLLKSEMRKGSMED
jgi:multidrug efflux pump subunit AcrA (membrane-fusion protein)